MGDWVFWQAGKDAKSCAKGYLELIKRLPRGIILIHDFSNDRGMRSNMWPLELVHMVVDWLQENEFQFRRIDSIPQVEDAASVSSVIALQARDGHFISPQLGGGGAVLANGSSIGAWEPIGVRHLDDSDPSKIALCCLNGNYISPQHGGGGAILANGPGAGEWETLTRIDLDTDLIALRCQSGHFILPQQGGGGEILANSTSIGDWEALRVLRAPE